MPNKERSRVKRDPIYIMYNALMSIGCCASADGIKAPEWRLLRIRDIADAAMKEMNVDHTELVRKVILPDEDHNGVQHKPK